MSEIGACFLSDTFDYRVPQSLSLSLFLSLSLLFLSLSLSLWTPIGASPVPEGRMKVCACV